MNMSQYSRTYTVVPIQSYQYSCTYVPTILGMWNVEPTVPTAILRVSIYLSSGCHCATCCLAGHQPWEAQWGGTLTLVSGGK